MLTTFHHSDPNDVGQERFRDQACFRMASGSRRKRAAFAPDEMFPVAFVELGRATHLFQNRKGRVDPSFTVFLGQ